MLPCAAPCSRAAPRRWPGPWAVARTPRAASSTARWRASSCPASPPLPIARSCCCRRAASDRRRSRSSPACERSRGSVCRVRLRAWRRAPGRSADKSTPASRVCIMPAWSTSMTNFSYPMARPPSSQPAVCSTKLTPARQVGSEGVRGLERRLRVRNLRGAQTAAGAKRDARDAARGRPWNTAPAPVPACRRSARPIASRSRTRSCRAPPARPD